MKKIIAASALVLTMASTSLMADIGIGLTSGMGFGVAVQLDGKYNLSVGNAGIAADYVFRDGEITKDKNIDLSYYVAGGVAYYWRTGYIAGADRISSIDIRVPVGLDLKFAKVWDAFLEADPALEINSAKGNTFGFGIDAALGIRYHF